MEKTISPESFAMICFLVLMQNGDGLEGKAPTYIGEKMHMLMAGYDAFAYLDVHNMQKVINWHRSWNVEIPAVIAKEFAAQTDAAERFGL